MSPFPFGPSVGPGYQNQGWQSTQNPTTPYTQPQANTNIIFVTGLDEALARSNARGSDMTYFDQDRDYFYRIKVDIDGRKTWATFEYSEPGKRTEAFATAEALQSLAERVAVLENRGKKRKSDTVETEVTYGGESDG